MADIRRSQRIRNKSLRDTTIHEDITHTTVVQSDAQTRISSGDEHDSTSSEEDDVNNDSDYEEHIPKRKISRTSKKNTKKSRTNGLKKQTTKVNVSKNDQEYYCDILKDFKPTYLFEVLSSSDDVSMEEIVNDWLDQYSTNRNEAMKELINFLLGCCGSLIQVAEHDVINNDSANETVSEIQITFHEQKVHEFHLLLSKNYRKKSKFKPLYKNFVEFMSKLIDTINETGLFYIETKNENEEISIETGPLIIDILTWVSSFSVCKIRSLRYVSSLAIYTFQDRLTELIVNLDTQNLFKLRKQLQLESKKKRPNKKTIEQLETSIIDIQSSMTVIESNIDNIIKLCFVHRFKDVDELIRSESIYHLSTWIENHPEYFFKVTYLKYFGWLLSDPSDSVRLNVLKILTDIVKFSNRYKNSVGNVSLRQFFERFKSKILDLGLKDINFQVKLLAIQVLIDINSFGYLEDSEILDITSLMFSEDDVKVSSTAKNAKFLNVVAKFFSQVEKEQLDEYMETQMLKFQDKNGITLEIVAKVGIFMKFLIKSLSVHLQKLGDKDITSQQKVDLLFQAAEFLQPHVGNLIEPICNVLVFDGDLNDFYPTTYDSKIVTNEVALLLPDNQNTLIQYVTVLGGLCHASIVATKLQNKKNTIKFILPHLKKIFTNVSLDSEIVLSQLLNIFQLFQFKDWVEYGEEKSFDEIIQLVLKIFGDSHIALNSLKHKAYDNLLNVLFTSDFPNIKELWLNKLSYIKISLDNFLQETEFTNDNTIDDKLKILFMVYLNKLTILGKYYRLEFDNRFSEHIFNNVFSKLSDVCHNLDSIKIVDFKWCTIYVTWNLQYLYSILMKNRQSITVSKPVLVSNKLVYDRLMESLLMLEKVENIGIERKYQMKYIFINPLIDMAIATKMFALELMENDYQLKKVIENDYPMTINENIKKIILDVFLYLESSYGKTLKIILDRFDDEDVNLNDLISDEEDSNDYEKELALYVLKIKSLLKLSCLDDEYIEKRIRLNKDILGDLYNEAIDEAIFQNLKNHGTEHFLSLKQNSTNSPETGLESVEKLSQDILQREKYKKIGPIEEEDIEL